VIVVAVKGEAISKVSTNIFEESRKSPSGKLLAVD